MHAPVATPAGQPQVVVAPVEWEVFLGGFGKNVPNLFLTLKEEADKFVESDSEEEVCPGGSDKLKVFFNYNFLINNYKHAH